MSNSLLENPSSVALSSFSCFGDQIKSLVLLQPFEGQCIVSDLVFATYLLGFAEKLWFLIVLSFCEQDLSQIWKKSIFSPLLPLQERFLGTPNKQVRESDQWMRFSNYPIWNKKAEMRLWLHRIAKAVLCKELFEVG